MPRLFFVLILAGFFSGVFLRSFFVFAPEFTFLFLILGAVFGVIFYLRPSPGRLLLNLAVLLTALSLGILRYDLRDSKENITPLFQKRGEAVSLSGFVSEDPQSQEKFTRAVLKTPEGAKILLTLPHYPEVRYGDKLEVEGKLREPENFSEFNW